MAPIQVETLIRADLDVLWQHTQDPVLHARWDLRFTEITPLAPGRFRYTSRFLGVTVTGLGTHAGERHRADGGRTSALRFRSADPLSLIHHGSGYWRYAPEPGGVRFTTGFDYSTRWGALGQAADRVFRPVFARLTALSFDRLRRWLETGVEPEHSRSGLDHLRTSFRY
ncbi:SRPBCC family protein [Amycolatopsis albispora]|uniref:Polyketide cyclase n=1 Tax=Amycolatopsis albispora TaxID=1804986 RepID=A0A344L689_9PSEU|nr:SRPBCC family protein [Amycolatopsis albispora]AXB43563.1 hypothetical protein A4R43_14285 [Amycolatopsis albispora]